MYQFISTDEKSLTKIHKQVAYKQILVQNSKPVAGVVSLCRVSPAPKLSRLPSASQVAIDDALDPHVLAGDA